MKFDEFWKKIAIISFITILVVLKLSVKKSPAPARPRSNLVIPGPGPGPGQKLAPGRSLVFNHIFVYMWTFLNIQLLYILLWMGTMEWCNVSAFDFYSVFWVPCWGTWWNEKVWWWAVLIDLCCFIAKIVSYIILYYGKW